jgi:hypothetical protein
MADNTKKGASLNPLDFISGGLLDDVDVTWKNVRFEMYDYDGKSDKAPCLGVDLVTGTEGPNDKPYRQRWSCGSAENWEPSEDGSMLIPVGKDSELRKASNVYMLLTSLDEAGFPRERLNDGNVFVLEGLKAHMIRKDAPKRPGLSQDTTRRGRDGKEYEKDNKVLCVSKIIALPWEGEGANKKAGKGKAKDAAPKSEPQASTGGDVDTKAKDVLMRLLIAGGGKIAKKDVPAKGFNEIPGTDPDKNKIMGCLFRDDWIKSAGFTLADDGIISVG